MTCAARVGRRLAAAGAALLLAACGGDVTGVEASSGGPMIAVGGASRTLDRALVGRWSRLVLTQLSAGLTASETRWTFLADGRLERRLITSNLTLGLADQVLTLGTWSTAGDGTVTIVLDDAARTTVRLPYAVVATVDGAVLTLGGLAYERLEP